MNGLKDMRSFMFGYTQEDVNREAKKLSDWIDSQVLNNCLNEAINNKVVKEVLDRKN